MPLNLDYCSLPPRAALFAGVVSRILSTHPGPWHRLCVPAHRVLCQPDAVDAWLRSAVVDYLEKLEFFSEWLSNRYFLKRTAVPQAPTPASTFRFSCSLRVATICECHLPDATVQTLQFPQLKHLGLEDVNISEGSLHTMIAGCPVLECLLLFRSVGFRCVQINSPSLRGIGVDTDCFDYVALGKLGIKFRELIIEDASLLEKLVHLGVHHSLRILIISAPKLETVGYNSDQSRPSIFTFGTTVVKVEQFNCSITL